MSRLPNSPWCRRVVLVSLVQGVRPNDLIPKIRKFSLTAEYAGFCERLRQKDRFLSEGWKP